MKKVKVGTAFPVHTPRKIAAKLDPYTKVYPDLLPAKVEIKLKDGRNFSLKKDDYKGFFTQPLTWKDVKYKFKRLTADIIDNNIREQIINVIGDLENRKVEDLTELLAGITIMENVK